MQKHVKQTKLIGLGLGLVIQLHSDAKTRETD